MKKVVFALIAILSTLAVKAQESQEVYSFLRLPVSAHAAALGGDNITIDDDDPTVIFHNPALISNVADKSINLNFITYMEGAKTASASFVKAWGERATWGVSAQYMDYGSMKEMSIDNIELGKLLFDRHGNHLILMHQLVQIECCSIVYRLHTIPL